MISAKWMKNLKLLDKCYFELKIPGTHNSATKYINAMNPLQSQFGKYSPAFYIVPCIFSAWTRCQNLTIYEQLVAGVRFIDIRVTATNNNIVVSHSFCGILLKDVLDDMTKFYKNYGTSEICVLSIKRDYENRKS